MFYIYLEEFLTRVKTVPPSIPLVWYSLMISLLFVLIFAALKFHQNLVFVRFFKWVQIFQLLALYAWYFVFQIPLSDSLPFYHCRLAMFAVVFLPNKKSSKQYFALLGTSGAIFALGYPVFDPYDFPHITSFSFLIGHYALLVNSLVYLLNYYDKKLLKKIWLIAYTFLLNLFLVGVNQLTGGNYGLLARPPIIKGENLLVNYLLISFILSLAVILLDYIFRKKFKNK
ncbi:putative membrane protein [Streptococcus sp. DD10]|uniref:YwaF family protein n=1 Tax=Streptococcus sp. DD10 TaxID=1777878 RepID=UPI0007919306|nr:TIGR02206 family membrane protein [Streptococcus sp. DD10]KXT76764.1 putative membrane protein [Streptococcus sp. DD10]